MRDAIRRNGTTIIVAMLTATVTAGAPAIAHVTSRWLHLRDQHVKPWADDRYAKKAAVAPYIRNAGPSSAGVSQSLSNAQMDSLCRDADGCEITLAMINWDAPNEPGNVASTSRKMFISQTSRWFRFSEESGSPQSGRDNDGNVTTALALYDCYLEDAETSNNATNGRSDLAVGFGLLNLSGGGTYPDATTTCRVIVRD